MLIWPAVTFKICAVILRRCGRKDERPSVMLCILTWSRVRIRTQEYVPTTEQAGNEIVTTNSCRTLVVAPFGVIMKLRFGSLYQGKLTLLMWTSQGLSFTHMREPSGNVDYVDTWTSLNLYLVQFLDLFKFKRMWGCSGSEGVQHMYRGVYGRGSLCRIRFEWRMWLGVDRLEVQRKRWSDSSRYDASNIGALGSP